MRELRRDPLTGDEVLLSEDRVLERIPTAPAGPGPESCPFCPGHESSTTPAIDTVERDGTWVARAFANRRPAVALEGVGGVTSDGPYEREFYVIEGYEPVSRCADVVLHVLHVVRNDAEG